MPTRAKSKPKFKRVLLKLSGEALGGEAGSGISPEVVLDMAQQIAEIHALGVQQCGGTGNPYFSTDTAAALRANEMNAEAILKATKVDGIYDSDPKKNPTAKRYTQVSYQEALTKQLKVMDAAAFALCMDNAMPIIVFDLFKPHNIKRVVMGEKVGTLVTN